MTQSVSVERTARAGSPARAVVHAAGVDTEYLRSGRGDAIVIVTHDLDASDLAELIAQLEGRYLVLAAAPVLAGCVQLDAWLNGFLEGLGVSAAHLLFHSSMALTLGDHDHV
ncbi:MAG: hypothetical protein ACREOK_09995 [Gemmatimonadaceae bacterium]